MVLDILLAHAVAEHQTTTLYIMHFMASFSFVKGKRFFVLLNMLPWTKLYSFICVPFYIYTFSVCWTKKNNLVFGSEKYQELASGVVCTGALCCASSLVEEFCFISWRQQSAKCALTHMVWLNLICIEVLKIYKFSTLRFCCAWCVAIADSNEKMYSNIKNATYRTLFGREIYKFYVWFNAHDGWCRGKIWVCGDLIGRAVSMKL